MDYVSKRLGKAHAVADPGTPRMRDALGPALARVDVWPDSDWRGGVYDGRILGDNDTVGDCVVVAAGNGVLVQSSYAGGSARMTDPEVLAAYIAATSPPYDPVSGANDSGLCVSAFLRRWNMTGITVAGQTNRLIGYAAIEPQDIAMVRRGIGLGGGILCGLQLPLSAQAQIAAGQPWDLGSAPGGWGAMPSGCWPRTRSGCGASPGRGCSASPGRRGRRGRTRPICASIRFF